MTTDPYAEPEQPTPPLPAQDRTLADCYREVEGLGPRGAQGPLVERLAEAAFLGDEDEFDNEEDAETYRQQIANLLVVVAAEVEAAVSVVRAERDEFREASEERGQAAEEAAHLRQSSRAGWNAAVERQERLESAESERDALREKVARVEALRDEWVQRQREQSRKFAAEKDADKSVTFGAIALAWGTCADEVAAALSDPTTPEPVHWIGDAPTSLHGNGAASFKATSRHWQSVTCALCLSLRERSENWPDPTTPDQKGGE